MRFSTSKRLKLIFIFGSKILIPSGTTFAIKSCRLAKGSLEYLLQAEARADALAYPLSPDRKNMTQVKQLGIRIASMESQDGLDLIAQFQVNLRNMT